MGTRNSSGAHNGSAHAAAACRGAQTTVCLIVGAPISLEWPILHIIGGKEARWTGSNSRRPFAGYSSPENKAQSLRAPRFSRQIWSHLDSHQLCLGAPRSHQRTWVDKDGAKPHQSSDILSPKQNLGPIPRSFLARCGIPPLYPRRPSPPSDLHQRHHSPQEIRGSVVSPWLRCPLEWPHAVASSCISNIAGAPSCVIHLPRLWWLG